MIFEYIQLAGMGNYAFTLEFVERVLFLVFAGIALALAGFKIKGVWGASLMLMVGVFLFLYNEGVVRF